MLGPILIVVVVVVVLPVSLMLLGGVTAAVLGWALKDNGERRCDGEAGARADG